MEKLQQMKLKLTVGAFYSIQPEMVTAYATSPGAHTGPRLLAPKIHDIKCWDLGSQDSYDR